MLMQPEDLSPEYQYFKDPRMGGAFRSMDFCPVVEPNPDTGCTDGNSLAMPGSRVGPNSLCVKGDSLAVGSSSPGDVCVEVSCADGAANIRYLGDDEWYPCPEGTSIRPRKTFSGGRIVCPRYAEVCPVVKDRCVFSARGVFILFPAAVLWVAAMMFF
ncbi:surface protease GP63 [Trypanosoma rangeli]|uniref:Leishmanolysin-like peptidase n=1 Tax=Trypanosoma rangeli TaxID=5698 RepID=A0A3R7KJ58_TRYRA|nr:surface protease GP63 [Trypanosoma rangeli]RNF07518.1 surface protease GP63 [Trypanosoma rangeli]|eukprot:RNF07518.1 surface protease GP63 [Trypanosoma rangeli]